MAAGPERVLVSGITGKQGGATARALLGAGIPVRGLVRDASSPGATSFADAGAELVVGDLNDPESLAAAVEGVRGVFSIQMPVADPEVERTQARNLIGSAKRAGVRQFVQTTVAGAGQHRTAPGWADGQWAHMEGYFESKAGIQDDVRQAGFESWTLLKPSFFMENLLALLPNGAAGGLATIMMPDTVLSIVAVADIGAAAAAAFAHPQTFDGIELELASDRLSLTEIATIISSVTGIQVTAPSMTPDEALAAGMPGWGLGHGWNNEVDSPARPEYAQRLGLQLTNFQTWAGAQLR